MSDQPFTGTIVCSLVFLRRLGEVLLARKVKELIIGYLTGHGGKQELGETIRQTAVRELFDETGKGVIVKPEKLHRRAVIYFHNRNKDGTRFIIKVHVYVAWWWEGEPKATDEMAEPSWFPDGNLPFEQMPPGDRYWLPQIMADKDVEIIGHIHYSRNQKRLIKKDIRRMYGLLDKLEPES